MNLTIPETIHKASPNICYKGSIEETAKSGTFRTFLVTIAVRAGTSSAEPYYGYKADWRLCYGSKCTSYKELKNTKSWHFNDGYHDKISPQSIEVDTGSIGETDITLDIEVNGNGNVSSTWDFRAPLPTIRTSSTNTAPDYSGGTITVKNQNKNGQVLNGYISENINDFYIEWSSASDKEDTNLTYTLEESAGDDSWSIIGLDLNSLSYSHHLTNFFEGETRRYRVSAKDPYGYVTANKPETGLLTKNTFTLSSLSCNPSLSDSISPITFTFSGENKQGGVIIQYKLTCNKITIHNCESVISPFTIHFYDSSVNDKTGPYICREDFKALIGRGSSCIFDQLTFTITATNSNGSKRQSSKDVAFHMENEDDTIPNIYGYTQYDQYKSVTEGKFYIFRVIFQTLNENSGNGGAFYTDTATNLLIESSSFIQCHSVGQGGAIFFNNTNGKSFLKMICSTNSYSSANNKHFCYIYTKSSYQCTNRMEYSSVANLYSTTNRGENIYLENKGIIKVKSSNMSKNECYDIPTIECYTSISSSVEYNIFENNSANVGILFFNTGKYALSMCNVIGNIANSHIIYLYDGSVQITKSCIKENQEKTPMFNINNKSGVITIINCTIDNTALKQHGSVIVDRTPSKSFVNKIYGLQNNDCLLLTNKKCKTLKMIFNNYHGLKLRENYISLLL